VGELPVWTNDDLLNLPAHQENRRTPKIQRTPKIPAPDGGPWRWRVASCNQCSRSGRRCAYLRPGKGRPELISRWARHPALPGPDTLHTHTHGRAWNRPSPTAVAMVTLAQAQNRARWPCTALLGWRPLR